VGRRSQAAVAKSYFLKICRAERRPFGPSSSGGRQATRRGAEPEMCADDGGFADGMACLNHPALLDRQSARDVRLRWPPGLQHGSGGQLRRRRCGQSTRCRLGTRRGHGRGCRREGLRRRAKQ
jgi:hypothetical protein